MRHEKILNAQIAAAAWPTTMDGLVLAEPAEPPVEGMPGEAAAFMPTPAAPEFAAGVGGLLVAAYVGLLVVFFTLFAGSATALFAITICAGFVAVFFTVPRIFLALEPDQTPRPSLPAFMEKGVETLTGHSSGSEALVQMLIVPVLLMFGLLAMGIVGKIFL